MSKLEGAKTVVVGGRKTEKQQYCGTVGGQSVSWVTIDSEIKSTKLKGNALAPPDFITNSIVGINWRLAFGVWKPTEPEEWQDRPADINLNVTKETANNPFAIWNATIKAVFK